MNPVAWEYPPRAGSVAIIGITAKFYRMVEGFPTGNGIDRLPTLTLDNFLLHPGGVLELRMEDGRIVALYREPESVYVSPELRK